MDTRIVFQDIYQKNSSPEFVDELTREANEINSKFLHILRNCNVYDFVQGSSKVISIADIKNIVNAIEYYYRSDQFFDSDLHDDAFENFNIISPISAYNKSDKEHFLKYSDYKFANQHECNNFLKNRCKLFCLYIYLRRCAILYRDTSYKEPFNQLIHFLSDSTNLKKFKDACLRVSPTLFAGDYWSTGLHEWLTCKSLITALNRTAGREKDAELKPIEPCLSRVAGKVSFKGEPVSDFDFHEFNWIDFQFLIRTETKYIIFSHNLEGHPGAVYGEIVPAANGGTKGSQPKTHGSNEFHSLLDEEFNKSTSILQYIKAVTTLHQNWVLHDATLAPVSTTNSNFLANGTRTTNCYSLSLFQNTALREARREMHMHYTNFGIQYHLLNSTGNLDKIAFNYTADAVIPSTYVVEKVGSAINSLGS